MPAVVVAKDDQYVLNHCTRFLARDDDAPRHDLGEVPSRATRGRASARPGAIR